MPNQRPDIEERLIAALQARSETYAAAHRCLQSMHQRLQAGEAIVRLCPELQRVLQEIRKSDEGVAALQAYWHEQGTAPGHELTQAAQHDREQLEQILQVVELLRAAAAADQSALAPQLDEGVRGRRMRAAYAAAATD